MRSFSTIMYVIKRQKYILLAAILLGKREEWDAQDLTLLLVHNVLKSSLGTALCACCIRLAST